MAKKDGRLDKKDLENISAGGDVGAVRMGDHIVIRAPEMAAKRSGVSIADIRSSFDGVAPRIPQTFKGPMPEMKVKAGARIAVSGLELPKGKTASFKGGSIDLHSEDGIKQFENLWNDLQAAKEVGASKGKVSIAGKTLNGADARQKMREIAQAAYVDAANELIQLRQDISKASSPALEPLLEKLPGLEKKLVDVEAVRATILKDDSGVNKAAADKKGALAITQLQERVDSVRNRGVLSEAQAMPKFEELFNRADKDSPAYKSEFARLAALVDAPTLSEIADKLGVFDPTKAQMAPAQAFDLKRVQHTANAVRELVSSEQTHLDALKGNAALLSDRTFTSKFSKKEQAFLAEYAEANRRAIDVSEKLLATFSLAPLEQFNKFKTEYSNLEIKLQALDAEAKTPANEAEIRALKDEMSLLDQDLSALNKQMLQQSWEATTGPAFTKLGDTTGLITSMHGPYTAILNANKSKFSDQLATLSKQMKQAGILEDYQKRQDLLSKEKFAKAADRPAIEAELARINSALFENPVTASLTRQFLALETAGSGDLLIRSVQRIPRYGLFVADISKNGNSDGAEDALLVAGSMVSKRAEQANRMAKGLS